MEEVDVRVRNLENVLATEEAMERAEAKLRVWASVARTEAEAEEDDVRERK